MDENLFFCEKCKNFSPSNLCDYCGKKNLRSARANDPVYLTTKTTVYAGILDEALKRNKIPFIKQEKNGGMLKYLGLSLGIEEFSFYVPFGERKKANELLNELFRVKSIKLKVDGKFTKSSIKAKRR